LKNPSSPTEASLAEAHEQFVENCSICHGIDGRGDTLIGRNMYPQVPNLANAETQQLTDGELFYIISNGVRFTGMPAWGDENNPESTWALVTFIRRLPQLSPDELEKSPERQGAGNKQVRGEHTSPRTHPPGRGIKPHKQ